MKAAFQGELGSNSHALCCEAFADYEPVPCLTFTDAFNAVKTGMCEIGVIAIENSTAGPVVDVHALLPNSGLKIIGERFKKITFDLMALPGSRLDRIKKIRSHPMAFPQCRRIIEEIGAVTEPALDTAGAARELSRSRDAHVAVLAPPLAAELYGLEPLKKSVQDDPQNTTRFIVISAKCPDPAVLSGSACLTSIVFKTRDVPAALYKAIGSFATNGVNLLKLESCLEGRGDFRAVSFYAEIEGSSGEANIARALEELVFFSREFTTLGTYACDPFRNHTRTVQPARDIATDARTEEDRETSGATLERLRHSIDNIDAAVIHLLAERFKITRQVGALKARHGLPSSDPARELRQITRLRRLAEAANLDQSFAEKFLAFVIHEVVDNHRRIAAQGQSKAI